MSSHPTVDAAPLSSPPALIGGRYARGEALGRGGTSRVYAARDELTGREVALKWIPFTHARSAAEAQREIAALRRLERSVGRGGVARLLDDGFERHAAWLVTERVTGRPFPGEDVPLPWEALRPRLMSLLIALARVHGEGVIHRDIKPDNVLVDACGNVVLIDFGIASPGGALDDTRGERPYGTPEYLAPERWTGVGDARSDLYAVGVMLWRSLAGRSPWDGVSAHARVARPLEAGLAPPHVVALCAWLTDPSPDRRPPSAEAVIEALDAAHRAHAAEAAPVSAPREFHGPDRLVHLAEDAAELLWRRTRGDPAAVREVLDGWVRERFAAVEGPRLRIDRASIEELDAWDPAHVPAGGLRAWLSRARRYAARGRLHAAEPLLRESLRGAAAHPTDARILAEATRLWARVVFGSHDQGMLDRFLYELRCVESPTAEVAAIESLARALAVTRHWTGGALDAARAVPRFEHAALERLRLGLRVDAARKVSPGEALPDELRAIRRAHPRARDPGWTSALALWTGRLRYVEERYADAARCYERAARGEVWLAARLNARLNAASAWMEAFAFERAVRLAARCRDEARAARLAFLEGRAEWIWRTTADRAGRPLTPDFELVEAARHVHAPDLVIVLAVTEATVAFRAGDRGAFARLATAAREACGVSREPLGMTTLGAMEVALGLRRHEEGAVIDARELRARGLPRLALEVAALVTDGHAPDDEERARYLAWAEGVPRRRWRSRMGVFSVDECLSRLGVT